MLPPSSIWRTVVLHTASRREYGGQAVLVLENLDAKTQKALQSVGIVHFWEDFFVPVLGAIEKTGSRICHPLSASSNHISFCFDLSHKPC